ncbi:MAG: S8 family serine peptidase, partial [Candidatus Bathyarchaeia archaeon]
MRRYGALLLILAITSLLTVPVSAAPKMQLETRLTWDLDMVNSTETGYTGKGVYVAVLDTGLAPNWKDYFPPERVATHLGKGFKEDVKWDQKLGDFVETGRVYETTYIGSTGSTHGTHVTSTIIGYNYYSPSDELGGLPLNPVFIQGVAPDVTVIPVKVLSDYNLHGERLVFGTDRAVAAGIRYATDLAIAGYRPMVITMSLGGPEPSNILEEAIDYAIANGVIVVASAGNEGEAGMGWPGAYQQVISVGACGWKYEWYWPEYDDPPPRYRLWWLQDSTYGYNDVAERDQGLLNEVYICDFSSRGLEGQDLDVVAPGSWVRGPYPGAPGYSHLPWWSEGHPRGIPRGGSFFYVGGTSMAAPHVTGIVAMMLEKNPTLTQAQVEEILENTALPIPPGSMTVWDLYPTEGWHTYVWGKEATGSGLVQADSAVASVTYP